MAPTAPAVESDTNQSEVTVHDEPPLRFGKTRDSSTQVAGGYESLRWKFQVSQCSKRVIGRR
jgi:hypothetical protein